MNIGLRNHHTPYLALLSRALPEHTFFVCGGTEHAPSGWRLDHRPLEPNVCIVDVLVPVDAFIMQTDADWDVLGWVNCKGVVVLSHNRPEFEGPAMRRAMQVIGGSSNGAALSISPMKTEAWIQALVETYGSTHKQHHTIAPYVDVNDYGGWTGEGGYVLTVANNLRRPLFDLDAWLEATRGLPVKLVGEGNDGIPGAVGPAKDWGELRALYRGCGAYLSVCRHPFEDGYNLSLLEAMATGAPCFALSSPTVPAAVEHDPHYGTLWAMLALWLQKTPGPPKTREAVAEQFPLSTFREKWLTVLNEVTK